jgi:hypothetical protein
MDSREAAILKTLLYSSLFDYPLKKEEIYNFLIGEKITKSDLPHILKSGKIPIEFNKELYFPKGLRKLVAERYLREKISIGKLKKAKEIIKKLSLIPTIKLIGISGTLAMKNCRENDDIDIFIISEKGLAWTTRLLTATLLRLMGIYRDKNSKMHKDKICLNLVLDRNNMSFKSKDLFTAHEIVQLLPIFESDEMYGKFINANEWVKQFMPNVLTKNKADFHRNANLFNKLFIVICKLFFLEKVSKILQLSYMKKSITKERLEEGFIGLHPFDYKEHVLKKYQQKLAKFRLK